MLKVLMLVISGGKKLPSRKTEGQISFCVLVWMMNLLSFQITSNLFFVSQIHLFNTSVELKIAEPKFISL